LGLPGGPDFGQAGPCSLCSPTPFDDWLANLLNGMRYTVLGNESGLPSLSLPTGTLDGLPAGVLLCRASSADGLLLPLAAEIEAWVSTWFDAAPPLSVGTASDPKPHR
jgi:amidase